MITKKAKMPPKNSKRMRRARKNLRSLEKSR